MDDRRFDQLTRTLGGARSRRSVIKGLVGGLAAGLLGRPVAAKTPPPRPGGAGATCSTEKVQQCLNQAAETRKTQLEVCGEMDTDTAKATCRLAAQLWYDHEIRSCQSDQCPKGELCIDGHCCREQQCCSGGQICHTQNSSTYTPYADFCCADGGTCCGKDCCSGSNTCCEHYDGGSISFTCSDLHSDPKNCGACRTDCDQQQCINGACGCPPDQKSCSGPLNSMCCQADEYCQGTAFGYVTCAKQCVDPCEVWDETSGTCQPKDCGDDCHYCDSSVGHCVPSPDGTECGSNLVCCQGSCQSSCDCSGQADGTSCGDGTTNQVCCKGNCVNADCQPGQQLDPSTCECSCTTGETCGPFCCPSNKVCCPDTLSGQSCRDPNGNCGCGVPCGGMCCGQYEFCCVASDDTFHCVANSGDKC